MKHTIIFKAVVGSQSYGTSTPESDIDYKGIYIQDNNEILSMRYKEQFQVSKDECYFEIRRILELMASANPTVIELLFSPDDCIIVDSPQYRKLREVRDKFLTKKCGDSFGGYAVAQIKKAKGLDKKMNWEKERIERKDVMDFCWVAVDEGSIPLKEWLEIFGHKQEDCGLTAIDHMTDCYHLYLSHGDKFKGVIVEDSNQLRLTAVPKGYTPDAVVYYNWREYSKHCREFREYQEWLECRNTQRYVDVENHNQKIDGKNLMHCRRLLDMAMEIAETGTLTVKRPNAEYLLQIRKGKVSLEEVIDQAEADLKKLDDLFKNCSLPDEIDKDFVNDLLLELRTM